MSYLDYVQSRESGGDPYAKNPRSSALGPFQFIDSTWNDLMTRRPDLGLTADGRTDPVQARRAADAFTQENEGILRKAGYEPDDNMRYLAHRFGPQGALSLLGAPADAPVSSVVGQGVLAANPDLAGKSVGALTRAQAFSGEQASPYAATEGQQAISSAMRLRRAASSCLPLTLQGSGAMTTTSQDASAALLHPSWPSRTPRVRRQ
jgi:hypothetical protein